MVVQDVLDPSLAVLMITSTLVETGGGVVLAGAALLSSPAEVLWLPLPVLVLSSSLPLLDVVWDGGGVVEEPPSGAEVAELALEVVEPAGADAGVEVLLSPALELEDDCSGVGVDDGEEAVFDGPSAED